MKSVKLHKSCWCSNDIIRRERIQNDTCRYNFLHIERLEKKTMTVVIMKMFTPLWTFYSAWTVINLDTVLMSDFDKNFQEDFHVKRRSPRHDSSVLVLRVSAIVSNDDRNVSRRVVRRVSVKDPSGMSSFLKCVTEILWKSLPPYSDFRTYWLTSKLSAQIVMRQNSWLFKIYIYIFIYIWIPSRPRLKFVRTHRCRLSQIRIKITSHVSRQ